jgi:dUTP pyrophosphatase
MKVLITKLHPHAQIPKQMREGDAAFDLYASEDIIIAQQSQSLVSTGIALCIPNGYVGLIWDRSGLAAKSQLTTMGGVIDSNYRGEIKVILRNFSSSEYKIQKHDRIAQMIIQKHESISFEEVAELPISERNENAFGSSGK